MTKRLQRIFSIIALNSIVFSPALFAAELIPVNKAVSAPHLEVTLPAYQSNTLISLYMEKGQVLLVDFWASWCGPCRESFPWMTNIQAKYKDQGLKIVAINLDQERDQALDYLQKFKPGFSVLFDTDAKLPEDFGVIGMPTSFLIDRQGRIRSTHIGFHSKETMNYESEIIELLAE